MDVLKIWKRDWNDSYINNKSKTNIEGRFKVRSIELSWESELTTRGGGGGGGVGGRPRRQRLTPVVGVAYFWTAVVLRRPSFTFPPFSLLLHLLPRLLGLPLSLSLSLFVRESDSCRTPLTRPWKDQPHSKGKFLPCLFSNSLSLSLPLSISLSLSYFLFLYFPLVHYFSHTPTFIIFIHKYARDWRYWTNIYLISSTSRLMAYQFRLDCGIKTSSLIFQQGDLKWNRSNKKQRWNRKKFEIYLFLLNK